MHRTYDAPGGTAAPRSARTLCAPPRREAAAARTAGGRTSVPSPGCLSAAAAAPVSRRKQQEEKMQRESAESRMGDKNAGLFSRDVRDGRYPPPLKSNSFPAEHVTRSGLKRSLSEATSAVSTSILVVAVFTLGNNTSAWVWPHWPKRGQGRRAAKTPCDRACPYTLAESLVHNRYYARPKVPHPFCTRVAMKRYWILR